MCRNDFQCLSMIFLNMLLFCILWEHFKSARSVPSKKISLCPKLLAGQKTDEGYGKKQNSSKMVNLSVLFCILSLCHLLFSLGTQMSAAFLPLLSIFSLIFITYSNTAAL